MSCLKIKRVTDSDKLKVKSSEGLFKWNQLIYKSNGFLNIE